MIYFKNNSVTFDLHLTRSILEPPPWERIPQILVSIRLFLFCAPNCAELTCCVYLFKRLVNSWRRYYILFTFVSRDITLPTKVRLVKAMVFPVVMWELDCEESWAPKNWCFWTVVLARIPQAWALPSTSWLEKGFLSKCPPWEAQSSPRVARESWGWRSSHCRA